MKKLQNNFTTPEQSRRLLELGVPTDSADCYLLRTLFAKGDTFIVEVLRDELYSKKDKFTNMLEYLPCWSAGRLMEIIDICALGESSDPNTEEYPSTIKVMNKLHIPYVEYLVKSIERAVQLGTIDFSKLEE